MERLLKQIISRDALRASFVNSIDIPKFVIREIIENLSHALDTGRQKLLKCICHTMTFSNCSHHGQTFTLWTM